MLSKYVIEHKKFKKPVTIGYNEWLVLCYYDGEGLDKEQSEWFLRNLPTLETMIPDYQKKYATILRIGKAQIDTSFEAAYNAYNCKVGKKEKARKIWDQLPEPERQLFFKMLPDYDRYLTSKRLGKAYFETFLNNHYWKNDYRSMLV